jgi:hypothetical protein
MEAIRGKECGGGVIMEFMMIQIFVLIVAAIILTSLYWQDYCDKRKVKRRRPPRVKLAARSHPIQRNV